MADPRAGSQPGAPARPRFTWFFALRPEATDAVRIEAFATALLASCGVSGRRIAPERLHVTLDLVGHDVGEGVVAAARRAADGVCLPPFDVRFDATATFRGPSGPFVLLGGDGMDAVRGLRTVLGCALADRGFRLKLAYEPHMTLCYDARHRVARCAIDPVGFRANGFALVRSHVGLSHHELMQTWPLTG